MDQKLEVLAHEYVNLDPDTQLAHEEDCDTLLVYLPGFKKEQLRLQLTNTRNLRITGERPLADNKYVRLQKEFPVSTNCNTNIITAKLEDGILYVRQPKMGTPSGKQDHKEENQATSNESHQNPNQRMPPNDDQPQPQKTDQETAAVVGEQSTQATRNEFHQIPNQKMPANDEQSQPKKTGQETASAMADQKIEGKGSELADDQNVSESDSESEESQEEGKSDDFGEDGKRTREKSGGDFGGGRVVMERMRLLLNLVVGILVAMVLGLCVTNWIRSDKEHGK